MPPRAKRSASAPSRSGRQALRLQGRACQGAAVRADALAQAGDAVARSAECRGQFGGERHIVQHHVVVQRGVAEQHVQQLAGVVADRCGGQADAHRETAVVQIGSIDCTSPTMSRSTAGSSIASSGISTLCSTAIAWARASIDAASLRT